MIDRDLLREAEANGTFDLASLEEALNDIRITSYNFLYKTQRELVNHRRFDFKASELKHMNTIDKTYRKYPRKFVGFVEGEFISDNKRKVFKRSPFYNTELDIFKVTAHPEIFDYTYMVFVEGKLLDTINLYCAEDKTYVIFDIADGANTTGVPVDFFEDMVARNVDITVFFIPNCAYGTYTTNRNVLLKFKDNLELDRFNIANSLDTETEYITFVNSNDLLFGGVITDTTNSKDMLRFTDKNINDFKNRYVHLNVFGFRHLFDQIEVPGVTKIVEKGPNTIEPTPVTFVKYSNTGKYKAIIGGPENELYLYRKGIDGSYSVRIDAPVTADYKSMVSFAFSKDDKFLVTSSMKTIATSNTAVLQVFSIQDDGLVRIDNQTAQDKPFDHITMTKNNVIVFTSKQLDQFNISRPYNGVPSLDPTKWQSFSLGGSGVDPVTDLVVGGEHDDYVILLDNNADTLRSWKFTDVDATEELVLDVLPSSIMTGLSISHDKQFLAITHEDAPYVTTYRWELGEYKRMNVPNYIPTGIAKKSAFSKNNGNILIVAHEQAPYVAIYKETNGQFMRYQEPSTILDVPVAVDISATDEISIYVSNEPNTDYEVRHPRYFSIPIQDMPLPVENVMIFKNVNGMKLFAHDITLKSYYPNYYEVLNNTNGDDLSIYLFYSDDTKVTNGILKYQDMLDVYKLYRPISLDNYIQGTLPTKVRDLTPENYNYDIKNYNSSAEFEDHLKYKINKLKAWIIKDADLLRTYLKYQFTKTNGYFIDCSQVDLTSKIRNDNHAEVDYESEKQTFTEPHYVFILPNAYGLPFRYYRFFIDGELYVPDTTYHDSQYEYFYIPTRLISHTSIIDIERFDTYSYEENLKFTSLASKKSITFKSGITVDINDIFLVDMDTMKYIDRALYQISVERSGEEVDIKPESFKRIPGHFYVRPLDASLVNVNLRVFIKEHFHFEKRVVETTEDIKSVFKFESKSNNDPDFIRVFKNGRLVPSEFVSATFDEHLGGTNVIVPTFKKEIGDIFVADYTPYKYKTIYNLDLLPEDGFLDLSGIISRPFDFKWYDAYINGRKLSIRNITIISPTKIFVKNVKSLKHFVIVEKDRDEEYFSLGTAQNTTDRLWEYIRDKAFEEHPKLEDLEKDIITDLIDVRIIDMLEFYNDVVVPTGYINPDLLQVTKEQKARYAFSRNMDPILLNPDLNIRDATQLLPIFPK